MYYKPYVLVAAAVVGPEQTPQGVVEMGMLVAQLVRLEVEAGYITGAEAAWAMEEEAVVDKEEQMSKITLAVGEVEVVEVDM